MTTPTEVFPVGTIVDVENWAGRGMIRAKVVAVIGYRVQVHNGGHFHLAEAVDLHPLPADSKCDIWGGGREEDGVAYWKCGRPAAHPHDGANGMGNHSPKPLPQDTPPTTKEA